MSFKSFKRFINKQHKSKIKVKTDLNNEFFKEMLGKPIKTENNNFFPKDYKTEEEKKKIENDKMQDQLDYLKEKQIKSLENVN